MINLNNVPEQDLNSSISNLASILKLSEADVKAMVTEIVGVVGLSMGEKETEEMPSEEPSEEAPDMEIMTNSPK